MYREPCVLSASNFPGRVFVPPTWGNSKSHDQTYFWKQLLGCWGISVPYLNSLMFHWMDLPSESSLWPCLLSDSFPSKNWDTFLTRPSVLCHELELQLESISPVAGAVSLAQLSAPSSQGFWFFKIHLSLLCFLEEIQNDSSFLAHHPILLWVYWLSLSLTDKSSSILL